MASPITPTARPDRGSALLLSILAILILTSAGVALLYVAGSNNRAARSDQRAKRAFYLAEAGLEAARETLRSSNFADAAHRYSLDDELATAAGANHVINLDPASLRPIYSGKTVTGFTGAGDDVPIQPLTSFDGGWYAVYLSNDAAEGRTSQHDGNSRVTLTAVGAGADGETEVAEEIVIPFSVPSMPSVLSLLGPTVTFDGGSSNGRTYYGDDCPGGTPGLNVPVVGVSNTTTELQAEAGVKKPNNYHQGTQTGIDTVDNIGGTMDPTWKSCQDLLALAKQVRSAADVVGTSSLNNSQLGTATNPKTVFVTGDYNLGTNSGGGVLWVTGTLTINGSASWNGVIFAVGRGAIVINGNGNGNVYGAEVVANISGPDGVLFTADDCAGPDGIKGNSDDGIAGSSYLANGGGNGRVQYCTPDVQRSEWQMPFQVDSFRER